MLIQDLYLTLQNMSPDQDQLLATVIDGAHLGEQLLIENRQPICYSPCNADRFLWNALPMICEAAGSTLLKVDSETILLERIGRKPSLVICGGGHVGTSVLELAKKLNFSTTVLEDRVLFANHARQALADRVICDSFENGLQQVPDQTDTYFVVATRGHRYDKECLTEIFQKPYAYVGMMGSRGRVALLKKQLLEEGIDPTHLDALHAPIGLDILAETPTEIAFSIVSELILTKNKNRRTHALDPAIIEALTAGLEHGVLCTIVRKCGSAPRSVGTRMAVFEDRRVIGTIGGGCVEADVISEAITLLRSEQEVKLITVSMSITTAEDEGLVCGGTVDILLQKF